MATANTGIKIEGLTEFRAAVRQAAGQMPSTMSEALKAAGVPVIAQAASIAPRLSGALASGYSINVSGAKANVVSRVPYAGGAEWGTQGKWSGFMKYGSPPRTVGVAIEDQSDTIAVILFQRLEAIMSILGWAH